jgi:glycine cleavage system aminomethyltransferase T
MNASLEKPIARSALLETHSRLGARLVNRRGWWVPEEYGDAADELATAREGVAVGEQCGTAHLDVVGEALSEVIAARWGVGELRPGTAAPLPAEEPARAGDARRLCRLTRTSARLVSSPPPGGDPDPLSGDPDRVDAAAATPAWMETPVDLPGLQRVDVSPGLTTLLVAGPRSPDLLARLVRLELDPGRFPDRRVVQTSAAGVPLFLLRWDRGPVLAYDLAVGRDVAEYFWEQLIHAGNRPRVALIGAAAMEQLG